MTDMSYQPKVYERLDMINDDFHICVRLLCKAHAVQAAPEVMDVLRIALERCHALYQQLAFEERAIERRAKEGT